MKLENRRILNYERLNFHELFEYFKLNFTKIRSFLKFLPNRIKAANERGDHSGSGNGLEISAGREHRGVQGADHQNAY